MTTAATEGPAKEPLTERGRRTRDGLVAAARVVFEDRGFAATRMGDIAEAAGVSHGTVYTWFDTKEALLHAVIDGVVIELYEALKVPDMADPVQRIARANRAYLDAYRANARLLDVVEQVASTDEHSMAVLTGLRRTHVDRVARTIQRLQADGQAVAELDARDAAAALCAMVEGFARHWFGRGEHHDEGVAVTTLTDLWARSLGMDPTAGSSGTPATEPVALTPTVPATLADRGLEPSSRVAERQTRRRTDALHR